MSLSLSTSLRLVGLVWLLLTAHSALSAEQEATNNDSIEPRQLTNIRQVTDGLAKAGEGYFSPDGRTIIFQAEPRDYPFFQIFTQKIDGGEPKLVSTGRGRTTCSYFSPDGARIIFASSHLDPKLDETEAAEIARREELRRSGKRERYNWVFDRHMEIFSALPDGSQLRRLTEEPGYDAECAFSSDGGKIVFCSDRDGDPDLYIMNADGSGVRQLTNSPGYDGGPFFSPDGRWICFRTDRRQEDHLQIHVISVDGRHDLPLTTDLQWVNWAPYWHPTEPYLIWCGADHSIRGRPNYDLWLMKYEKTDGRLQAAGPVVRITDHASADVLPVFSPDGKRLMWTSNRTTDRTSQLWIADIKFPK